MSNITFDEFLKIDMRVGTIFSAERVAKSDKLLQLQVDFGELGVRQIIAGIGKDFTPADMVDVRIVAVVNLEPRKLMGLESHGMILASNGPNGLSLVGVDVPNGSRIG